MLSIQSRKSKKNRARNNELNKETILAGYKTIITIAKGKEMGARQSVASRITALQMRERDLHVQSIVAQRQSQVAADRARQAVRVGRADEARMCCQEAVTKRHLHSQYDQARLRLSQIICKIRTMESYKGITSDIMSAIKDAEQIVHTNDVKRMTKLLERNQQQFDAMTLVQETVETGLDTTEELKPSNSVNSDEVEQMMKQIEEETELTLRDNLEATGLLAKTTNNNKMQNNNHLSIHIGSEENEGGEEEEDAKLDARFQMLQKQQQKR